MSEAVLRPEAGGAGLLDDPLFTAEAPNVCSMLAEELARRHYGVEAKVTRLHSERDTNYLAQTRDGRFILKITNKAEPHGVTDFQTQVLLHLEREAPNLPTPHLVRTLAGAPTAEVEIEGGRSAVRLLTYLDGVPLKDRPRAQHPIAAIGESLAKLDRALASFDHPHKTYDLLWDSSSLSRLRPLLAFVSDTALREVCEQIVDRFDETIRPRLTAVDWQVIHNDANLNNLLVSETTGGVSGIFDFGDIIHAPRVNELAVTCAYHVADDLPFSTRLGALVSAYHRVSPLTPTEVDLLYDLILGRFVTTILITYWRASMFPHNQTYILRNNPVSVDGLRILRAAGPEAARSVFRAACHME